MFSPQNDAVIFFFHFIPYRRACKTYFPFSTQVSRDIYLINRLRKRCCLPEITELRNKSNFRRFVKGLRKQATKANPAYKVTNATAHMADNTFQGIFKLDDSHLSMSICPKHRDSFGIRWRCQKRFCAIPSGKENEGDRSITTRLQCDLHTSAYRIS